MKERPILFSAPMVRALLDGSKTQTRRALRVQPLDVLPMEGDKAGCQWVGLMTRDPAPKGTVFRCKFGVPGDLLWVRETWYCDDYRVQKGPYLEVDGARELTVYFADNPRPYEAEQPIWRPSIHMPCWASRILLEIVSVRVERLQDISEADARAEGTPGGHSAIQDYPYAATPIEHYRWLWDLINGASRWDANPWVWVVEFKRVLS